MSRRMMPFGVPCHDNAEWVCQSCERVICGECEPSPAEEITCRECFDVEDPEPESAA
jgi:hypothetical protein